MYSAHHFRVGPLSVTGIEDFREAIRIVGKLNDNSDVVKMATHLMQCIFMLLLLALIAQALIITSNNTRYESEILPIKYWQPAVGSKLDVRLVSCGERGNASVPTAALCFYAATDSFFEDLLARAAQQDLAAIVLRQVKRWPGEGHLVTNGQSAFATQLPVHEVSTDVFNQLKPGMQVSLVVERPNPVSEVVTSPYDIIWTSAYALFVLGAVTFAVYLLGAHLILYCSGVSKRPHPVVFVTLGLQLAANLLRFIDLLSLYNARLLYPTLLSDILFTAHLLPSLLSSLLTASLFRVLYVSITKMDDSRIGFLPDNKKVFYTFSGILVVMELFLKIAGKTFASGISWWIFIAILMYAAYNIFVTSWYAIWYFRMRKYQPKNLSAARERRAFLMRLGPLFVFIGGIVWLLTLVVVAAVLYSADSLVSSLWGSRTITYIGFFAITLTGYGNLLMVSPPRIIVRAQSSTSAQRSPSITTTDNVTKTTLSMLTTVKCSESEEMNSAASE